MQLVYVEFVKIFIQTNPHPRFSKPSIIQMSQVESVKEEVIYSQCHELNLQNMASILDASFA